MYLCLALAIVVLPPLLLGLIRKVKARLQNRVGAPIWQPFFDLIKLLRKRETLSTTASSLFRFSAALNLALAIYLAIAVPWFTPKPFTGPCDLFLVVYVLAAMRLFSILAAMDTGSAFGAFAASREATLSFLVEPAAVLSLAALAVSAHSSNLVDIFASSGGDHRALWALSGTALLMAGLVELSRMPIDDPTTHLELTMVHEAMILEASARNLALFEFTNAIKLMIFFGLSSQCLLRAFVNLGGRTELAAACFSMGALLLVTTGVGVFESLAVKLYWRKAPEFIAYSLTLALLACIVALGASVL
jgi:formate hydrogenlyase subunit 4